MRVVYKNELTRCSYKCGRRYNIGKGFWVFIFVDVRFSCFIQYFSKWTVLFQNIQSIKISGTHLSKPYFDEHRWSPNPNILNTSFPKMLNFFPSRLIAPFYLVQNLDEIFSHRELSRNSSLAGWRPLRRRWRRRRRRRQRFRRIIAAPSLSLTVSFPKARSMEKSSHREIRCSVFENLPFWRSKWDLKPWRFEGKFSAPPLEPSWTNFQIWPLLEFILNFGATFWTQLTLCNVEWW